MPERDPKPNYKLQAAREQKMWTQEEAAEKVGIDAQTYWRWENGEQRPRAYSLRQLCQVFGLSAEALGFGGSQKQVEGIQRTEETVQGENTEDEPATSQAALHQRSSLIRLTPEQAMVLLSILEPGEEMMHDPSKRETLRKLREIISALALTPMTPQSWEWLSLVGNREQIRTNTISEPAIPNLEAITQQYRRLQRHGVTFIEDGLRNHLATIEKTLESTLDDTIRSELWRILAQTQLLLRLNITKKSELGKAKTWNEVAIASAQRSGDTLLIGGTIGHLAHLYLMEQGDRATASQLLESAQAYTQGHPALNGWFTVLQAAIVAKEGKKHLCHEILARATDLALSLPQTPEYSDVIFTDFSEVSVDAWAGYCLLAIEDPKKSYERLLRIKVHDLAENRQAIHFHDISRAFALTGELAAVQAYAFQSIDKALATNHLYVIPQIIALARKIQEKDRHEPHAAAITEYAQMALLESQGRM